MEFPNSWEGVCAAGRRYGARFPELVAAQWALESGWGQHTSGKNNFFGLKGSGSSVNTKEFYDGQWVTIKAGFIDFPSLAACVEYLVTRWYKDWQSYRGINRANSIEEAAKVLVLEGYATDPDYSNKLLRIVKQRGTQAVLQNKYANLVDAVKHFEGSPHQLEAFRLLNASLTESQQAAFTRTWRGPQAGAVTTPEFPLKVPYFYQRDSKTGHGERMCQSSSIAMRIEQIGPKIIGDDDSYLKIVQRFGDTVSQVAHQRALDYLNLRHQFRQNGTEQLLCELLEDGMAVPIGVLHKGNVNRPTGGGHWIVLVGYDSTSFIVHDPFGEMDLINGGYIKTGPTDGRNVRYSRKNLMRRWLIQSQSDGWLWIIRK
jgi:hypothetical protein